MEEYIEIVESMIEGLGEDPATCRTENENLWIFPYENEQVFVQILPGADDETVFFQAFVLIKTITKENKKEQMLNILKLNHYFKNVYLQMHGDDLYVGQFRSADGLDSVEVSRAFSAMVNYNRNFDYLMEKHVTD